MKAPSALAGLILVTVAVLGLAADAAAEPAVFEEEEVVVTAKSVKTPVPQTLGFTEIITQQDIQEAGATQDSLAGALAANGQPVDENGANGPAALQLDGAPAGQTQVMVNGVAAQGGFSGQADLSAFPAIGVERIEIAHGPLSAMNGANALGGVVNVVTDLTGAARNRVALTEGAFQTGRFNLAMTRDDWGIAAGVSHSDGDRSRSGATGRYLLGQYDFLQEDDQYLRLYLQAFNKTAEDPGPESAPKARAEQSDANYALQLNGKRPWAGGDWEYKLYSQRWETEYDDPDAFRHDRYHSTVFGADAAGGYAWGGHEVQSGVSLKRTLFDIANTVYDGERTQEDWALFAQDTYSLNDRLWLVGGLRQEWSSDFDSPLLPRLGLVQTVNPDLTVKYGYGKAFRAPAPRELYGEGSWAVGNPALRPEDGERFDLSAEYRQGGSEWQINLFRTRLKDGISWVPVNPADLSAGYTWRNFAKGRADGVTVGWKRTWRQWITGRVDYHWLDRQDQGTDGVYRSNNFFGRHQLVLDLTLSQPRYDYGFSWRFVADRTSDGVELPDYDLIDLNFRYRFNPRLTLGVGCTNLTDRRYAIQKDYPMPGRSIQVTMEYFF